MDEWILDQRRRALEETFFLKREHEIIEKMRHEYAALSVKEQFKKFSGIDDEKILDLALEYGFTVQTLSALTLIPLLEVAWADKHLQAKEVKAILQAAHLLGLKEETPAYALIQSSLERSYNPDLFIAWSNYVTALRRRMTDHDFELWRGEIMGLAYRVAKSAGGILGMASLSRLEMAAIHKLESSFGGNQGLNER